jgi:hypothetical protein
VNEQGLAHETLSLNPPSAAVRSVSLLEALEQVFQWRQEEEAEALLLQCGHGVG